jgi:hypothetical protein
MKNEVQSTTEKINGKKRYRKENAATSQEACIQNLNRFKITPQKKKN